MNITLALDTTPNTLHSGFYVAAAQGIYERLGLDVQFLLPEDAASAPTRVAREEATFALCPSEVVLAYHVVPARPHLMALATLLQRNHGAFVSPKRAGRERPAQLDGCAYASHDMLLESDLLSHMIRQDGGRGDFNVVTPPPLNVADAVLDGQADATWVSMSWEGVRAERRGIELNVFRPEAYGIPYGYAPVLVAHPQTLRDLGDATCRFVQGSALGYEFAARHPEEAARILVELAGHATLDDRECVLASQRVVSDEYLTREGRWGVMLSARWQAFVNWVCEQHLLKNSLGGDVTRGDADVSAMFTNQYLL